jgi:hypothetical protein
MLKITFFGFLLFVTPASLLASQSPYVDEEFRDLKSFSDNDIQAISSGQGWGLAKPAELNGVPGPAHVLELKSKLNLTEQQIKSIESVWQEMNSSAITAGQEYLLAEEKIEQYFRIKNNDIETLNDLLAQSAKSHSKLREIHLTAHIKMLPLLNKNQIKHYSMLRGYSSETDHKHQHNHSPK